MSKDNGLAIEKLPSLEDLLGVTQKAAIDVERIQGFAVSLRRLNRVQQTEKLDDDAPIPGTQPEDDGEAERYGRRYRTFGQQRRIIQAAYKETWKAIDEDGYRAAVEQQLVELKQQ